MKFAGSSTWSGSGKRTLKDSWGQDFLEKGNKRSYRVAVEYGKYSCYNVYGYRTSDRWDPRSQPGYTWDYAPSSAPNWSNHCGRIAAGKWWRGRYRGNDYTLSFGVKFKEVVGIDLSTQRSYSTDARLYYYAPVDRQLCCNNDDPATASKMRERDL